MPSQSESEAKLMPETLRLLQDIEEEMKAFQAIDFADTTPATTFQA
jgi:hypothetical protein